MIKENLEKIKKEIPEKITLIAVSKYKTCEEIMEAYNSGIRDFGENHILEMIEKYEKLPKDIKWHMIGHMQSNKVKKIIGKTHLIHSVDSIKIATLIDKYSKEQNIISDILLEVNIANEETKTGFKIEELINNYENLKELKNINIKGLMMIAPNTTNQEEIRKYFRKTQELGKKLNLKEYSYGMSNDYKIAIEENTTYVRIGTAIFGKRNYK